MKQSPRDVFRGLSCLLVSLSGGNSRSLDLLQGKMAASTVPILSIPRFVDVHDANLASPDPDGMNSAVSPKDFEYEAPPSEWVPSSAVASMRQRNRPKDSTFSSGIQHVPTDRLEPSSVSTLSGMNHSPFETPMTSWTFFV